VEQSQIKTHAPIGAVARRVCVIFPADLDADRLFADLEDLADLQDERDRPLGVAGGIVPVGGSFRADGKGRVHLVRVSKKWLKKLWVVSLRPSWERFCVIPRDLGTFST